MKPEIATQPRLLGKATRLLCLGCCMIITSVVSAKSELDQILPPLDAIKHNAQIARRHHGQCPGIVLAHHVHPVTQTKVVYPGRAVEGAPSTGALCAGASAFFVIYDAVGCPAQRIPLLRTRKAEIRILVI